MEHANLPPYVHQPYQHKPVQTLPVYENAKLSYAPVSSFPPMPIYAPAAACCVGRRGSDLGVILVLYILLVIIIRAWKL